MNKKEKVVPSNSRVILYNQKTKTNINMTVYEGVRKLIAKNEKAQELLSSNAVDVTVKLKPNGSVVGISLTPKNVVSPSDCSADLETIPNIREDENTENNNDDELEGSWWKDDSSSEDEDDLNFTLVLEGDIEAEFMETTEIPDVIEATQLPPGRLPAVLTNAELPEQPVVEKVVEPDSTVSVPVDKNCEDPEEKEPWMECWNCKAPKPIPGIIREDEDNIRMVFCCDKPTRIKPTNTVIESNAKNYPYDSWVHHSFS